MNCTNVRKPSKSSGFTIVELLVVIVVIGILAAITIVAYTGISQKAVASALQSDLANASTRLKMFQVENSAYPTANNCPTPGVTEICLKLSTGNTLVGYSANNQSNPQTFLLIVSNNSLAYEVTNNSAPTQLASTMQPGVTPGAILELHAAKANNGTGPGINSPLTTQWFDTSGNSNHGTLMYFYDEVPWAGAGTPSDPYRLAFDGVDDAASFASPIHVVDSGVFSYEAWIKTTFVGNGYQIVMGEDTAGGGPGAVLFFADGRPGGFVYLGGVAQVIGSGGANDGGWHHIVFSSDGSLLYLYTDGVSSATPVATIGSVTTNRTFLGNGLWNPGFIGSVALARVYPFALTPDQIAQNYAAGPDW